MPTLSTMALLALLGPACWFDVRERRIPNVVTVAGAIGALLLRLSVGLGVFLDGMLGAGLALLVVLTPFVLGWLGGGDVKLLGAVGAFMGVDRLFGALVVIAAVGGLLAVVEATRRRALVRTLIGTLGVARQWAVFGRADVASGVGLSGTLSVPYGVAIAIGSLAWWFMGGMAF